MNPDDIGVKLLSCGCRVTCEPRGDWLHVPDIEFCQQHEAPATHEPCQRWITSLIIERDDARAAGAKIAANAENLVAVASIMNAALRTALSEVLRPGHRAEIQRAMKAYHDALVGKEGPNAS